MQKAIRVMVAVPGVLFLISGLRWLFTPAAAAESLGMPLLDGVARSTQVGDLGAFFFAAGAMILLGVITTRRHWLAAAPMLIGGAAVMRIFAWALHDADFATQFIAPEIAMTVILLVGGAKMSSATGGESE